ncbi:hypothetical protein YE43_21620 [Salmonella enterica subsp. enterica serovar Ohio]|nr:hypothetical protein [Salmonella enterica subsp. enterica serovar Ohio]
MLIYWSDIRHKTVDKIAGEREISPDKITTVVTQFKLNGVNRVEVNFQIRQEAKRVCLALLNKSDFG